MKSFRLVGLPYEPFAPLFELDDRRLLERGAMRITADKDFGYPCRVSLSDAGAGEELLLLHYEHLPAKSPYRASGPIFVRRGATPCALAPGTIPEYVSRRLVSLRAYDAGHMMRGAAVCGGTEVGHEIQRLLADATVAYIHLHNAGPGCFSCRVERFTSEEGND